MNDQHSFFANGKLLLTGEYVVLDGALALALPTQAGQSMVVKTGDDAGLLHWSSYEADGNCWFQGRFSLPGFAYFDGSDPVTGQKLATILRATDEQKPGWWASRDGWQVQCRLEFPRLWGLGTSSTLLSLLAQWSDTDPFRLLEASFGGSGYDIACARAGGPILFQRLQGKPHFVRFPFSPPYADNLFFIYLGQKQDSRQGIARYRQRQGADHRLVSRVSGITARLLQTHTLGECEDLLHEHETIVAETIGLPRARERYFPDYWGEIKSLGAWGGDFVLATSQRPPKETTDYFRKRGFTTIIPYREMVLPEK